MCSHVAQDLQMSLKHIICQLCDLGCTMIACLTAGSILDQNSSYLKAQMSSEVIAVIMEQSMCHVVTADQACTNWQRYSGFAKKLCSLWLCCGTVASFCFHGDDTNLICSSNNPSAPAKHYM
jgi:hypothetical protein